MSYLMPPPISHQTSTIDHNDLKVSQWLQVWDKKESFDVGVVGIPLSRSSISASGASESPLAVRQSLKGFTTYDIDHDIDFSDLIVRDIGDIRMHTTDILKCHKNIELGMAQIYDTAPEPFTPIILGGDHSITCPLVKAFCNFHGKSVGLIQFDTHLDVRSLSDGGPSNGTPIRGLLESGTLLGENIFQIGLHNFANSKVYRDYAIAQGITFYTMNQVRRQGLERILAEALNILKAKVDYIYVTVDIDVLDQAFLPGSPGSAPGGMLSWELFEAVHQLGREKLVHAMDIVCLDPMRDLGNVSVRTVISTMLSFLSGYATR